MATRADEGEGDATYPTAGPGGVACDRYRGEWTEGGFLVYETECDGETERDDGTDGAWVRSETAVSLEHRR